jgi:tripartite-type tricarboxylate transporter receptor subunit TctC
MMTVRVLVSGILALLAVALPPLPAGAQSYPSRPITLLVPFPAGGSNDVAARLLAQALSSSLGQPIVVENRGSGAGGTVGTGSAAMAAPDGYTLVMGSTSTLAVAPALYSKLEYDPIKSFAPVSLLSSVPLLLVATASLPANSLADLIALARAEPGQLDFGSAGVGTLAHLTGELFKTSAKIDVVHVPYRGGAPALADLMAGRIQFMFETVQLTVPQIEAGKLKPIAVTGVKRHPLLPNVPTIEESGIAGFRAELWFGLLAPAGTPAAIVDRLNAETVKALESPELRAAFTSKGLNPVTSTPQEFAKLIATEYARWSEVVKASGAKAE